MADDYVLTATVEPIKDRRRAMQNVQFSMRQTELINDIADDFTRMRHELTAMRQLLERFVNRTAR